MITGDGGCRLQTIEACTGRLRARSRLAGYEGQQLLGAAVLYSVNG